MAKKRNEWLEWTKAIIIAIVLASIIRYFIFAPVVVSGYSMMPTLHSGDRIIIKKLGEIHRFDIVVFHAPGNKDYIKRVIGLPGDKIIYKNDVLYINGKSYKEPYLTAYKSEVSNGPLTKDFTLKDVIHVNTVPKGKFFVMGDNRRFSKDSREIGVVSMDKIVGTASAIYWPLADLEYLK